MYGPSNLAFLILAVGCVSSFEKEIKELRLSYREEVGGLFLPHPQYNSGISFQHFVRFLLALKFYNYQESNSLSKIL